MVPAEGDTSSCQGCGPAHAALVEMLQLVHKASQSVKEAVGSDCPVFQAACPFKNCVTSAGVPLVLELETLSWGAFVKDAHSEVASQAESEAEAGSPSPAAGAGKPPAAAELEDDNDGVGLARKLKLGTTEAHKAAESVHFVREFIKGKVSREMYARLIVNLFYVYEAMEEALEANADHPLIDDLHFPDELNRTETLEKDAAFFAGESWREQLEPSPAAREYVARIREISSSAPELLIPHAYTRYLGDLSGGQLLRRAAVRGLKLQDDGSGVQFYIFRRIRDNKKFKNMYRARLDNLAAGAEMADRMVLEANLAFGFNTLMFQELDKLMGFEQPAEPLPRPPPVPQTVPAAIAGAAAAAAAGACPFAALAAIGIPMPEDHPPLEVTAADREALKKPAAGKAKAKAAAAGKATESAAVRWLRHPMGGAVLCALWAVVVAWQFGFFDR